MHKRRDWLADLRGKPHVEIRESDDGSVVEIAFTRPIALKAVERNLYARLRRRTAKP